MTAASGEPNVSAQARQAHTPGAQDAEAARLTGFVEDLAEGMGWPSPLGGLSSRPWTGIARRSTLVFTAKTMPWQRLRRPHVLKIRSLLEEHYQPATANRMLSALRSVLRECWQTQLMTTGGLPGGDQRAGGCLATRCHARCLGPSF
jgi:hypothetical protein